MDSYMRDALGWLLLLIVGGWLLYTHVHIGPEAKKPSLEEVQKTANDAADQIGAQEEEIQDLQSKVRSLEDDVDDLKRRRP